MTPMSWAHLIKETSKPLDPIQTACPPHLPHLEGIRAVVFDIYGTLLISASGDLGLHTAEQQEHALHSLLKPLGLNTPSRESTPLSELFTEIIRQSHNEAKQQGIPHPEVEIRKIWKTFITSLDLPPPPEDRLEELAVRYELATNPVWPMPELETMLASLKAKKLPMGIVSNAQFYTAHYFLAFFDLDLEALGFSPEHCHFSWNIGHAKPGIKLYQELKESLQKHNIQPQETLYVGNDRRKDIDPAAKLGFRTALFAGDDRSYRPYHELTDLRQPDATLTSLTQVTELLRAP